ncbi:DUF4326 domain-containing protein [Microbacterium hominis]|uniref:DUF4326 domain-containing protein n=1 Tax=Microbacterium hominis TaxID=162426 RepID=UPI00168A91C5|nr:DUF4326 domain-containing protein [Microbacterium hominis]QOC24824.1 DUF4326 domain-containing protein [Microbacterium hominis]QOC28877.1 DUF4326 domain-containing protein [Microbacterium hominis]
MPERIQQRRTGGWRKPAGSRMVSRPSKWGNPFRVGQEIAGVTLDAALAVELYREYLAQAMLTERGKEELDLSALRGLDLGCFCPLDQPCHADVLLELANPIGEEHGDG